MYLEISSRQTGKTQRLINALRVHLMIHEDNYAVVIGPNLRMTILIRENIEDKFQHRVFYGEDPKRIYDQMIGVDSPSVKWFFDEFDFNPYLNGDYSDPVFPIYQNNYYVTTPKKVRSIADWEDWENDFLLRLIVSNQFHYTTHRDFNYLEEQQLGVLRNALMNRVGECHRQLIGVEMALELFGADFFKMK